LQGYYIVKTFPGYHPTVAKSPFLPPANAETDTITHILSEYQQVINKY
jgi:hypothetical protein